MAGTELSPEQVKSVFVIRELYVLKSSGAAFRALLAEKSNELGYRAINS